MASTIIPIPQPSGLPILGNVTAIDSTNPSRSFALFSKTYGPIFALKMFSRRLVVISSQELVNELCDEKRFHKHVSGSLGELRAGAGDALFTAYHGEENWGIAHRILMPSFGPSAIKDMFEDMRDINSQLLLKWERFGPDYAIDPTADFTRLAFDTISLCSMSYRFNSFYQPDMIPFILAMQRTLIEAGARSRRPKLLQSWMTQTNAQFDADIKLMHGVCDEVIAYRKQHPSDKKDLLNLMLSGKDSKTGKGLSDENIRYQLLTFLIAGHETTSGLLSFTINYLLSSPSAYAAVQTEVDTVLGTSPIQLSHLSELTYINAVLRESLRMQGPVPMIALTPFEDTLLGGRYEVKKGDVCLLHINGLHKDPKVWGEDADVFRPERMLDGKFEALPPNAWKPFGNGARGCIGRPFAWQESLMMLATLFQKFDLRYDDPSYQLQIKQTLTVKPQGLRIHAIPRAGSAPIAFVAPVAHPTSSIAQSEHGQVPHVNAPTKNGKPLYVYFGGNSGSCEGFAQSVASDGGTRGYATKMAPLDAVEGALPTDGPVIILTSTYEGQPPDNAAHFIEWIKSLSGSELAGVNYAVFGAGHHDWVQTYQRIPTLVDDTLAERGATRLMERFAVDAGGPDMFGAFDVWEASLWTKLGESTVFAAKEPTTEAPPEDDLVVTVTGTTRISRLRQPDLSLGRVVESRLLTAPGAPPKLHIEFELPAAMEYRSGDYLAILPNNPPSSVKRVLKHFDLLPDTKITIQSKGPTTLPTDELISLSELFSEYVELGQPATRRNLEELVLVAPAQSDVAEKLKGLIANYKTEVYDKRLSVLDLLELHSELHLPLNAFIKMQPSMRIRQYSISSSPLWKPDHCTLTVSVIRAPSLAGHGDFFGVASNYLASLQVGDPVQLSVRPSAATFHLPQDDSVPIVMYCAGSGFAPMRGFIQERAKKIEAGQKVGPALLFVGCRAPEEDFLYGDEVSEWIQSGAVDVRPAFSRQPASSSGCKYVQDRAWHDRADITAAFYAGARFYTCGMSPMSTAVRQRAVEMISEAAKCDEEKAAKFFDRVSKERFATDVFG